MADRLDIVVFGATGFTGKYTLVKVHQLAKAEGRKLTWGVAGRSEKKLKEVLAETSLKIGEDLNSIPIIIADVGDEASLEKMTARANVIINCCGPFVLYGEPVVKACIATGTHHVDVTGEPLFIESMQLKYHKAAEEKGVYIVSACGFDSIPTDLGICFLEKNFEGTLNSVETYLHTVEPEPVSGPKMHYGTWTSVVNGIGTLRESFLVKKKLYPTPLPKFQPKLPLRFPVRRVESGKWAIPFLGADRDIILRSQRYFYEQEKKRPIQVHCYVVFESFITILMCLFGGFATLILGQFQCGVNLLLKHPAFFSFGFFSHEDPSEKTIEQQQFNYIFNGEGWGEKLAEGEDQYKTPPNKAIVGRVSVVNGYEFTCLGLALSAIMIITESKALPAKGGVYTTAAAFSKTSLVEQLQKNGIIFEILSNKDL